MSLESGPYFLSSVSFVTGTPVSRYIGAGDIKDHPDADVVVLPLGGPPSIWYIEKLSENKYSLQLNGRSAKVVNGTLKLVGLPGPPFEWMVIKGAPSPPPVGTNSFGIIVPNQHPQESWLIGSTEGDQAVPVPIKIGSVASSVVIVSALRD